MSSPMTIAALGSSFAAGPGIEPVADPDAARSARNYAHRLAERLGAQLVDLTVSGATTANVLDTPQRTMRGAFFPPQVEGIPKAADVVTITAGGNDLQFAGAMLHAALVASAPDSPILPMLAPLFPDGIPLPTGGEVERATAGLMRVVEAARAKAPAARVVLVDYLTVLDEGSLPATPFTAEQLAAFLIIQTAIGTVFVDAADRTGTDLLLASALSTGHALGSAEPWVQPFEADLMRTAGSFHPNALGMDAIAAGLEQLLTA